MGKEYPEIDSAMREWIGRQKMFFVATAPQGDGRLNCSPKGMDTFRILGPRTVAYLDLTGSGVETIAHLRENGRIIIMFCAFEGPPKTVRFYGKGQVLEKGSGEFEALNPQFNDLPGARSIIRIELDCIRDSCGYSTPLYDYAGERETLSKWAEKKGDAGVIDYQAAKNQKSLDGLPGLDR